MGNNASKVGSNLSSMGTSFGDIFFPSNPKLRYRAEELELDCKRLASKFEELRKDFDALEEEVLEKVMKYLKANGFESLDELDEKIQKVVEGKALEDWEKLKTMIGKTHAVEQAVFSVCGIATLGGAGVLSALVVAGVLSGPAGWAALGAIGSAVAVIAAVSFISAIIIGKVTQEKLKDHIVELFHARADAQLQVNRIGLLNDWMISFTVWMDMTGQETLENFDSMFEDLEKYDSYRWEVEKANEDLRVYDQIRKSWTGADPKPKSTKS